MRSGRDFAVGRGERKGGGGRRLLLFPELDRLQSEGGVALGGGKKGGPRKVPAVKSSSRERQKGSGGEQSGPSGKERGGRACRINF